MNGHHETAVRVAGINCAINALLACVKIVAGVIAHSGAVISDGIHSVTDMIDAVIVMIGIVFSKRHPDKDHPYGYERFECVAAVMVSVVIGVTGVGIALSGVTAMRRLGEPDGVSVGPAALWAALFSIVVKECMFRYTRRWARKTASLALEADAWHQRVDALSSVGSVIGVLGAKMGMPIWDPLASIGIGLMIIKAAGKVFADAMRKMTDRACDPQLALLILQMAETCEGVVSAEELKTRLFGNRVFAELTVTVDKHLTSQEAYHVAQNLRKTVTEKWEIVKACSVHIHPL